MVEDYKTRVTTGSKKKKISRINRVLTICIWTCLSCSVVMVVVCAVAYASNSDVFRVKEIRISGCTNVGEDEIINLLDIETGENLLSWNIASARQRLNEQSWIKDVSISRRFLPASVIVKVSEHVPVATVEIEGKRYLVSDEFEIFAPAPDNFEGLNIEANDFTPTEAGQEISDVIGRGLRATRMIESRGKTVEGIVIESGGRTDIELADGITLVFMGELTKRKIDMAQRARKAVNPSGAGIMDLTCENKIVFRNRGSHGS